MKKLILLLLISSLIIGSGCKNKITPPQEEKLDPFLVYEDYLEFEDCINKLKRDPHYETPKTPGSLLISFHENITDKQISEFIDIYKLETKPRNPRSKHLRIVVPLGHEYYWICKLTHEIELVMDIFFDVEVKTV